MQSDRMIMMAKEMAFLENEKRRFPELFPEITWEDDKSLLELLGIHIPEKETLARGFLKLRPSDFIVEEIMEDGFQTSISQSSEQVEDQEGETVYATLVKCGLSTLEAVDELAKLLGTSKEKIQYAGIKDKDAITSQAISIRGIPKEKVLEIKSPHFYLKDIKKSKGVIQKGGLRGNRFSILIRIGNDINDKNRIRSTLHALERIKKEGFYNFFYLQRFGTPRLNNYKWAISIIRGDYKAAVYGLISDPGIREIPYFINKRKEIISLAPDWNKVLENLKEFPLVFPSEIKVVSYLTTRPDDYSGALRQVEDQVVLWVSALASLLINRKISSYIMAGMNPPSSLPMFMSPDRNDWLPYSDDLEGIGLFPPNLETLRPFRSMMLKHREIETVDHPQINKVEITSEGLAVQFSLGKGEYATTFLSHFVTLLGGKKPEEITDNIVDVKNVLGDESGEGVLNYFSELNISKK